jgi:myo-inositol-hexaphosphate 3-phosphohydrolase
MEFMIADNTTAVPEVELPAGKAPNPGKAEDMLDTRSAAEVEADMLKQAEADALAVAQNRDPADIAAIFFHMFVPKFQQHIAGLSNKELRRLVNQLVGNKHPSLPDVPTFKDKDTGAAFKLGMELIQAKFMMVTKHEMDMLQRQHDEQAEEAKKIAAEAVVETQFGGEALKGNENE